MLTLKPLAAIATALLFCASANATVIDFDDLVGPGAVGPSSGDGFVDYGFQFSSNMDALDLSDTGYCYSECSGHSGKYGALNNYGGNMLMTMQGGGTFSVQDLWLRDWYGSEGEATVDGLLNGVVVGSVNVSLAPVWSNVLLNFGDVDTLRVATSSIFTIDDIQVNGGSVSVPEPSSIALLGLGLLGFAASRRKLAKSKNA